ncbi:hypothetical protein QR685DRAFT_575576 [Neurospora intermedia]|uniref:Uncharacterized protein n=1 Tax=Neurospora intermedia TaxID=5142 RepID=A0ABR3D0V8_NEUIN
MTANPAQPLVCAVGGRTTMVRFTYTQAPSSALRLTPPRTRFPTSLLRNSSFKFVSTKALHPERRLWSSPRAGEDSSRFGRPGRSGHRGAS